LKIIQSETCQLLILNLILAALVIVLILPVAVLFLEVLAAVASSTTSHKKEVIETKPSVTVLMPAHNEALVIENSIKSVLSQLDGCDQLLVVADNCTDDTARIAKDLGAKVIERSNQVQRGKGYALDYGLQHIKSSPPQVVIIADADCIFAEGAINLLATSCISKQRPTQALYIMQAPPNPGLKARIAEFAWLVKNKVRPYGAKFLGLPCQLMGTGMAFLWEDINKISLASGHIVEDMKLGIDLAKIKKAPVFLPIALVTSVFPPTQEATITQRARWEHGHLSVILNEAPSLFWGAIRYKNMQMFGLACDLIVPPLAVLALLSSMAFVLSFLFANQFILLLSVILITVLLMAVLLAWIFFGRHIISFAQLCYAPVYALIKIPLYFKFFFNRQVEWVRSKRD
jgi:cellulose synthase/poly-beta-1,6-N-acetylglucosamine synthase-like glycosyltransferase